MVDIKKTTNFEKLKVALVCDWLTTMGGAERVVLELHKMFPDAPIYTSSFSPKRMPLFKDADVRTSFIQKMPFSHKHQLWPVLRRFVFPRFDFSEYDLVISSSGAEAKGIITKPADRKPNFFTRLFKPSTIYHLPSTDAKHPVHINYCHSPTHYYWVRPDEYMAAKTSGGIGFLNPMWRFGLRVLKPWMKRWDWLAAQRPDYMIANSTDVQKRIKEFYNRDSKVVFPPVDTARFKTTRKNVKRKGFLIVGRQVHHKRFDLAVKACGELNLPLTVIGRGPEHKNLVKIAGPSVRFLSNVTDKEIVKFFQTAEAFLFPQEDDFGIVAAEALAAGTPVIAYQAGGSLDIVTPGKSGEFVGKQTVKKLKEQLQKFNPKKYNSREITASSKKFSIKEFNSRINQLVSDIMSQL